MNNNSIIKLVKNIYKDMPAFAVNTIIVIVGTLVCYLIGKVGPLTILIDKLLCNGLMSETKWIIRVLFILISGLLQAGIIAGIIGICYLIYRAFIFMAIEIQVCKLPDDYFSSHEDITAEALYKLLDPFHFHGRRMNMPPRVLEMNIPVIERLMSKFTKEQLQLIKSSPTSKYFGLDGKLNSMIRDKVE